MVTGSVTTAPPHQATAGPGVWLVLVLLPAWVQASGQLPPSTIEDRLLPSAQACRAFLEATWQTDQKKADPQPLSSDEGSRQSVIYSDGVVTLDDKHLAYEVEEGWQFRRPLPDIKQIRTSYSYERRSYKCDGAHLIATSISGYALEGYEALPDD